MTLTAEDLVLSRMAVACKAFRWLPGMLAVEQAVPGMALSTRPVPVDNYWNAVGVWLPDLGDPATLGCLLALVREAWGDPRLVVIYHGEAAHPGQSEGWAVQCADNRLPVAGEDYPSEGEALVAALEAAPSGSKVARRGLPDLSSK